MRRKVFLFSIGLVIGFLLLISLSDFNLAQAVMCSDRGGFCGEIGGLGEIVDCCAGVCADGSCSCLDNCCSLTSSIDGDRGDDCYCGRECRGGLTCIGSTCCDNRWDYVKDRDGGEDCWCHEECLFGQCIGGVCAEEDTCSPAGCACIDTIINCERLIGGEHDPSLICPDPTYDVCCCPQELPPPDGDGFCDSPCDSPCTCIYRFCSGDSVPIDCCGGSVEYVCCCPLNGNGNGNGDDNGNGNGGSSFPIGGNGGIIDLQSPLGCTTIEECISRMINFLFSLAVILTPLMIILAGFLYITAAGKPEKIVQAQKLITWTLIGFLIVSLARAIIYVITSVIGG